MFISSALTALALALSSATQVAAHGGVLAYSIAGTWYQGFKAYNTPVGQVSIQREWGTPLSPCFENQLIPFQIPTDPNLSCNSNGASLGTGQLFATVAAGSKVTAYWNTWPHTIGPVMVYMAKCPSNCTTATTSTLEWFKIEQAGLISGDYANGTWAMGELVANNNSWTTTIPATLPAGQYMLRHELLAIHTSDQPQFYPECAQLILTGGGSSAPTSSYLVTLPGAYKASDPGVTLDIYATPTFTNYTIPGPPVWQG
ncbi:glycoside hydrolase family 61 protein [Jaapia argillacea MUCL 33604]|uniref:AA9 family lytic polysaccharide monooxygenase n=1 Tax=Jaapia argillacea MUCL 33604 TaxID=933084 RepID=A0A067Q4K5_9AGAM|nr:glycoside hydrolase family 61 protein [Jaapia argillacea MUCL 33604]